ncbi:hypothetical protein JQ559_19465 [Bradyrhizobium viridifuturi]|jgi:hypothetical protein|uniref:hypothetical protein n=1 Tax=Bradyrhizobium TaxID=374 RepID=UPI00041D031D|nr:MULTISPECIES: hypothetical protein [Bradyrhizobium]MBN4668708.1 hypothetical protein [Pandoraea nosoerga]QRI68924.1 hypothetical protein JQ507_29215 [Bradyrhizobium sp. PSBB068]MBR1022668.1 hypothetical protein [Bradyrhizobium viridifuturi]MBR1041271.1 hypothetical protein [Bradyrhizobium viridifuturi]MBR1045836.1 hypothetical protein [Bradyrhizobium viridifuturi]
MAKSHEYNAPNLFLDNFAALEKSFRPAAIVSPIPSRSKRVHDIASRGAEFVPEPMSPGGA